MDKLKISKYQQKVFIYIAIVFVIFTLFWRLFYIPKKVQLSKIRQEIVSINQKNEEIESIVKLRGNLPDGLIQIKKELVDYRKMIPKEIQTSSLMKLLTQAANELNIEVNSIKPGSHVLFLDTEGNKTYIEGRVCHKVPIEMKFKCKYKVLGDYLHMLFNETDYIYTIEEFVIEKKDRQDENVTVKLNMSAHIMCTDHI